MSTEKLVKSPERRKKRNPMESRNRLAVKNKDPNYEYRIVNDTQDGRVEQMLDQDWEIETDPQVSVSRSRIDDPAKVGQVHEVSVGLGTKAVLMKKRKDWYAEDQAAKQEYVDKTEEAMRPNPNEGTYGRVELTRK